MRTTTAIFLGLFALWAAAPAQASPDPMTRQEIMDLAVSGVGYSYWWGHGCWRMDGLERGLSRQACGASCELGDYVVRWWRRDPLGSRHESGGWSNSSGSIR